jgi:hypothetical protein
MISMKKALVIALVSIAIALFVFDYASFYKLARTSPRVPDYATGEVCPLNNHGTIFYVTSSRRWTLNVARCGYALFGLAAVALNVCWKALPSPIDDMPKKFY